MHDTRPTNHSTTDPTEVAELWASRLGTGSIDELMELYSVKAPLHMARSVVLGKDAIRDFWERSPLLGGPAPERVVRANGVSVVRWSVPSNDAAVTTTELLIRHGRIVEQWIGEALLTESVLGSIPVELSHSGAISNGDRQGVIDTIEKVLDGINEPITHVRVRMEHTGDRNRDRPTSVRAVIDMKGGAIRVDVHADTAQGAIDVLETRLRSQIRDRAERRLASQHRGNGEGSSSWRHGDHAADRPSYFPRPAEDRELVRHKSVAPIGSDVEEAVFDLTSMDYDFYLFTDSGSDCDALVHHDAERDVFAVAFAGEAVDELPEGTVLDDRPVATLDVAAARELLDVGHEPWVFYVDQDTGRGHVLYRRYDGHYGVIVPIDEPD